MDYRTNQIKSWNAVSGSSSWGLWKSTDLMRRVYCVLLLIIFINESICTSSFTGLYWYFPGSAPDCNMKSNISPSVVFSHSQTQSVNKHIALKHTSAQTSCMFTRLCTHCSESPQISLPACSWKRAGSSYVRFPLINQRLRSKRHS